MASLSWFYERAFQEIKVALGKMRTATGFGPVFPSIAGSTEKGLSPF
jgi:hypothetical protein